MTADVSEEEKPVTPPVPEYLSPLRWQWILFVTRRQEVRFLYWPAQHPAGHRRIRMFDRGGYDIGTLVWKVCDACRVGSINKISITIEHQRQDLGRRLIRRALADGPGYTWQTTGQSPEAKHFFPALEKEMGTAFPQYGGVCEHLAPSPGHRPLPPGRHPRPVLEHGI
ncbi:MULTISPECIES: hypothetical protein [unclassified Streptomyces]|uniref:hypothetical protein n=1 Tax=unclassified Streptomyces TaxID=2593676 RepID=UPI00081F50DE|nr:MULTISPECIES: hypothetical protein [unclassified Streptomyces]MYZ37980.1 hypothetical protein [Streptomyces sp. SID4917]SCF95481.1 hypothetical protein GA0115259_1055111 [Streptomyces sp. MnatMP-M17]